MRKESTNQCPDRDRTLTLADLLRAKRTGIQREANARTREIDRQINLLESTDAESVMFEAREVLDS
jgi:hypothetical protein